MDQELKKILDGMNEKLTILDEKGDLLQLSVNVLESGQKRIENDIKSIKTILKRFEIREKSSI